MHFSNRYIRSRNASIAESASSTPHDHDGDIIDFRTFIDIFERLCREQPLKTHASQHHIEKIQQDNEEALIRREHSWNSSSQVPEKRILSNTIFSRHDTFTHQPETASKIPKTSRLEDNWKMEVQDEVSSNIEKLKVRGDLHKSKNISELETLKREMELIQSLPVNDDHRLHDSELHSAVSKIKNFSGRLHEAVEERRKEYHAIPGWRQVRRYQAEIMSEVSDIVKELKAENKMRTSPLTKREYEEKTFGWTTSEPIPESRTLSKRHRYRESRDRRKSEHHIRLDEGNPPKDWWGLYGSDKHRKDVIRKDIERHMAHEIKKVEKKQGIVSPQKILGGDRERKAIQDHMTRMTLQAAGGTFLKSPSIFFSFISLYLYIYLFQ